MSKYIALAALFVVLGTFKVGMMQGVVENHVDEAQHPYFYGSSLVNQSPVSSSLKQVADIKVTAYSSREEETDDTPFITASGTLVRQGVVAANWLPIGTKVKLPELFGEQVFVVEDRMNKKHNDKLDIWFPTTEEALRFGTQVTRVEVL